MANKQLASYGSLRDYLNRYIDPNKNWDDEDIRDYSLLEKQGLTPDQRAEGKTLLAQYLADNDAHGAYKAATAQAENEARKATAMQDYLHTRLAGYLPQLQAGAGQAGYQGLTGGQAVALRNDMAQKQADIGARKQTALTDYLQTYQGALRDNSATAIDQLTAIDSARETKQKDTDTRASETVDELIYGKSDADGMIGDDNKISREQANTILKYLEDEGVSASLLKKYTILLEGLVRDETKSTATTTQTNTQAASQKNENSGTAQTGSSSGSWGDQARKSTGSALGDWLKNLRITFRPRR